MGRRETQSHASIYDILAQTESQIYRTFFSLFVTNGIIIERAGYTGHGRIITVTILIADYLLQDNGHLFLIDHIRSSLHICLTVTKID